MDLFNVKTWKMKRERLTIQNVDCCLSKSLLRVPIVELDSDQFFFSIILAWRTFVCRCPHIDVSETKATFIRPQSCRGGGKQWQNGNAHLSVSCEWSLECQDSGLRLFSHQIFFLLLVKSFFLPFLPSSSFLSFFHSFLCYSFNVSIPLSRLSGYRTWYAKLPAVSVQPLAVYCKPANSFCKPLQTGSAWCSHHLRCLWDGKIRQCTSGGGGGGGRAGGGGGVGVAMWS